MGEQLRKISSNKALSLAKKRDLKSGVSDKSLAGAAKIYMKVLEELDKDSAKSCGQQLS